MDTHPERRNRSRPVPLIRPAVCALLTLALGLAGCGFGKLKKDVEEIRTAGIFSGSVAAEGGTAGVHVVLFADTTEGPVVAGSNSLSELMDTRVFTADVGTRSFLAGFPDLDGDGCSGAPATIPWFR